MATTDARQQTADASNDRIIEEHRRLFSGVILIMSMMEVKSNMQHSVESVKPRENHGDLQK